MSDASLSITIEEVRDNGNARVTTRKRRISAGFIWSGSSLLKTVLQDHNGSADDAVAAIFCTLLEMQSCGNEMYDAPLGEIADVILKHYPQLSTTRGM